MKMRTKQILAAVLALSALTVGGWATLMPGSFYTGFPFPGRSWVSMLGPYNEHLVRDVGGLYLALLVLSVWVALRPGDAVMRVAGLAWIVFSIPHFTYHVFHLEMFPLVDKLAMAGSLGGTVVLAALLMLPTRQGSGTWTWRERDQEERSASSSTTSKSLRT
jgi:hypothetical protein